LKLAGTAISVASGRGPANHVAACPQQWRRGRGVICVPPYLHPEMAIAALQRDIHALVEKPAGVYTKQVRELNVYAATKPGLTFAIMFNQRNNPLYQRIKEIISGGELGNIRRSDWIITTWWRPQAYYEQSAWRATWGGEGGGVLINQASHELDMQARARDR
jgi:UDP-N-acetyl-2-amino-2-deoxyglucuronate dehydrogenase